MEPRRRGRPRHPDVLTPAEWRVLGALREGGTNAEIAGRLGLSPDTVKTHISNMLAKLELRDRRALAAWRPDARPRRLGGVLAVPAAAWSLGRPLVLVAAGAATVAGVAVVVVALVALEVIVEGERAAISPEGTPAATSTPASAPSAAPTPTATPASPTPQPSATATPTAAPTATPAPRPTPEPTPLPDIDVPPGEVVTLAGSAMQWGYVDGSRTDARFGTHSQPGLMGLDVDSDGSVIVANYYNPAIRRIAPDGTVTTIAGGNSRGLRDGPADVAQFSGPIDVAVSPDGSIFVADRSNRRIRKVTPDGMVTTVAGSGPPDYRAEEWAPVDGPADEAEFGAIEHLALAPDGDLYIIDGPRIRRLSPSGWVSTLAGGTWGFADGWGEHARFGYLTDMAVDGAGNIYVLDINPYVPGEVGRVATIRRISRDGEVRTLFQDSPAHRGARLANPTGLAVTAGGDVYVANTGRNQIVQCLPAGELRAVAGTGEDAYLDGPSGTAAFSFPGSLAVGPDGTLFVADQASSTVRAIKLPQDGSSGHVPLAQLDALPRLGGVSVAVFAGRAGAPGFLGNGEPANEARFRAPWGLAVDGSGNVMVADGQNHAIRRISVDGTVSTIAGGRGEGVLDGPADVARFAYPQYLAVDAGGAVYVVESGNQHIRRIAPDGTVSTIEADGQGDIQAVARGPDGTILISREGEIWSREPDGSMSRLGSRYRRIWGLGASGDGSIFFTNVVSTSFAVKRMTRTGDVSTVFEDRKGVYGAFSPLVHRLAAGPDGAVYVADRDFGQVVRIGPDGTAVIVADHETIGSDRFRPEDIVVTPEGDLIVSDPWQHVIWKITIDEDEAGY